MPVWPDRRVGDGDENPRRRRIVAEIEVEAGIGVEYRAPDHRVGRGEPRPEDQRGACRQSQHRARLVRQTRPVGEDDGKERRSDQRQRRAAGQHRRAPRRARRQRDARFRAVPEQFSRASIVLFQMPGSQMAWPSTANCSPIRA